MTQEIEISEDLVRHYHEEGDLKSLLTLFDFQRRQMTRAEDLARAYLLHITTLEKQLGGGGRQTLPAPAREPSTKQLAKDIREAHKPPVEPKPKVSNAVDLDDL